MIYSRKVQWAIAGMAILLVGLFRTWPLLLEPNVKNSLKIYFAYVFGGQARISDILGNVDIACAVGPFDSFRDARFSKILSEEQIVAAEDALKKQNRISLGDNQFFLVGLRGTLVTAIYASNFFSSMKAMEKNEPAVLDCVDRGGFISPEEFGKVISIKLKEGA